MSKTAKVTEALTWQGLKDSFYIGNITVEKDGKSVEVTVDNLTKAIKDGILDKLVTECAVAMHDGDEYEVIKAMARNLSSQLCNMAKKPYAPSKNVEDKRYQILHAYVESRMANHKATNTGSSLSYWQWPMAKIETLDPAKDARVIKSVYDNMMSAKSKYPEAVAADATFMARMDCISKMHSTAKKLAKTPADTAELIAKLSSGNGAKLSADEAAKLATLLKSFGK